MNDQKLSESERAKLEGWTALNLGNHEQALANFDVALKAQELTYGAESPEFAEMLTEIGSALLLLGSQYSGKAEQLILRALMIQDHTCGRASVECVNLLEQLTMAYTLQEKYGPAVQSMREAVDVWEALSLQGLSPEHADREYILSRYEELANLQRLEDEQKEKHSNGSK